MASQVVLRCLELTFGKIPKLIEENLKYLSYNETHDDFNCIPCDKIIKKVFNNEIGTTDNFQRHLLTTRHQNNTITSEELLKNLTNTFLGKIPQIVLSNSFVLGMDGRDYDCALCEKKIVVSANPSATENNFSYHLTSMGHEEKLEKYRDTLSQLHKIYGGIPCFVLNHIQFLSPNGKHYFCTICEKHIQVHPSDLNETEISFDKHLHSLNHMRKAKEAKAFSLIPELKQVFTQLPNYMLKSIEYISVNGPNFFCSLCNTNIKFNRHDFKETEENFKLHILSSLHEEGLSNRRDPDNDVFNRLQNYFGDCPEVVIENLKYLSVNDCDFYCTICEETITDAEDNDQTKENLIEHFEAFYHEQNLENELSRRSELIDELKDLFGSVPESITDNISHIEFKGGNDFECVLCNEVIRLKRGQPNKQSLPNPFQTEKSFMKHLNSNRHEEEINDLDAVNDNLETELNEVLTHTPQFIENNFSHIGFDDNEEDFFCFLCDKTIAIVNGNKKQELTEQNFRTHLLSVGHMAKLKHKANVEMEATEKLESIFHKIPTFILNNIEHIEQRGKHFFCSLCSAKILRQGPQSTERNFQMHLFGANHKSNLSQEQEDMDAALGRIDYSFWRIPEFMLRNIDFLCTYGEEDLFCILCQEVLPLSEDTDETKKLLRIHMDSKKHQWNLKNF